MALQRAIAVVRDKGHVSAGACGWVSAGEDSACDGRQRGAGLCCDRRTGTGRHAPCWEQSCCSAVLCQPVDIPATTRRVLTISCMRLSRAKQEEAMAPGQL